MGKDKLTLRAMEPADIERIYTWENDPEVWDYSIAHQHYSMHCLTQYVMTAANESIYTSRQVRLMAVSKVDGTVGCIDLYDYDPFHHRAAVGLLIDTAHRGRGYAQAAIRAMIDYVPHLQLHQLYCHIAVDNIASIKAFQKCGFHTIGTLKDWQYDVKNKSHVDVLVLQIIL